MRRLRAISITLCVRFDIPYLLAHFRQPKPADLEDWLPSLLSVEKFEQLYVVEMSDHKPEKLLVH
jgi:hypothetical protein